MRILHGSNANRDRAVLSPLSAGGGDKVVISDVPLVRAPRGYRVIIPSPADARRPTEAIVRQATPKVNPRSGGTCSRCTHAHIILL